MSNTFAVIIAGSRDFSDYGLLCSKCNYLFSSRKPTCIICGEARGADTLGKRYAVHHGIEVRSFPADWKQYGRRAGILRNIAMLEIADALVAFWDGKSRGTAHMISIARGKGIPVRVIRFTFTSSG